MIVAAHHVRDVEIDLVEHGAEIVGRTAVGAQDDEVVELGIFENRAPANEILEHGLALHWASENESHSCARPCVGQLDVARSNGLSRQVPS